MIPIIIFGAVAIGLFLAAYISKRRFGLLGLALTAGATLSTLWTYDAGLLVASLGVVPEGELTQAITQSLVVLLPAFLLLFHGYTYKNPIMRIFGSLAFTVLALAFLVEPIGYALPLSGDGAMVYTYIKQYKDVIISVGVVLAVVDLFFTKRAKHMEKEKGKR